MPEREGTPFARALLASSAAEHWEAYAGLYSKALQSISAKRKSHELLELDAFLFSSLPTIARSGRDPSHLRLDELAKVMKWKLTRGKFRPLQKLVESNAPKDVQNATSRALQCLSEDKWEESFAHLTRLKGIGVATASAVLCIFRPDLCPFMADEVMESATDSGRDYTMPVYRKMRDSLIRKAEALGSDWTAEKVGKALWTAAILGEEGPLSAAPSNAPAAKSEAHSRENKKGSKTESSAGEDEPQRKRKRAT